MGNQNEKVYEKQLFNKHSQLQQYYLPQYGGKVGVDTEKKIVKKTFVINADEQQEFMNLVQKRIKLKHPNLGKYIDFQQISVSSSAFCGPSSKVFCITYQLLAYSLFNEIQNYCKLRKPIPQYQICRVFQSVASCIKYLNDNSTLHGDIKIGSIFLDKDRSVKLIDSFFLKYGKTNFQVILQDPKSMSLLAPEQLQLLRVKLFDSLELSARHEMFMIGLSMIEMTTIKEGMKGYNLSTLTINEQFFINAMNDIQYCGYSFQLSHLIMNCVHKIPDKRPTFQQFLTQIRKIKKSASNKNPRINNDPNTRDSMKIN